MSTFLQLFWMLCIYYPINCHIKNGNVVDEESMRLLTSFKGGMFENFKMNVMEAADHRQEMREILKYGIKYFDVSSDTSFECHYVDVDVK